jgi:hypothetical protein
MRCGAGGGTRSNGSCGELRGGHRDGKDRGRKRGLADARIIQALLDSSGDWQARQHKAGLSFGAVRI